MAIFTSSFAQKAEVVNKMSNSGSNKFYLTNKAPLQNQYFVKLPVTSIKPGGWVRQALELQREGLTGNLGEISIWLSKTDNAWLNKEGKGNENRKSLYLHQVNVLHKLFYNFF